MVDKMLTTKISDSFGRQFKKLRVSLGANCNFACVYCAKEDNLKISNKYEYRSADSFLLLISRLNSILHLEQIRLTGGEPTLYPELSKLIFGLKQIGIPKVSLTTNGYLLEKLTASLRESGLDSINVSLDAVDPNIFYVMSRGKKIERVLKGIEKALKSNIQIKLNCTVMKGYNDSQILPILNYAGSLGIPVRYIELMKMGHITEKDEGLIYYKDDILNDICEYYNITLLERTNSSTSEYYETNNGYKFGIIANESTPFCHDCNRLRLDSAGLIYGCLSSNSGYSILEAMDNKTELEKILIKALGNKQLFKFTGSSIAMQEIGG